MVNNNKDKLCMEVSHLFNKKLDVVLQNTDKSLFNYPFHLSSEELLYLYFLVKKKYKTSFDEKKLIDGGFITIDDISSIISN